jgi:outer membrane protein OmpA-like peptidoglycan-associated protein
MVITNKQYIKTLLFISIALFISSGCAKTTIVLLPDPDGKIGYVTVYNDAGSIDITQAREATVVRGRESQPTRPKVLSEEAIESKFSSGLASLPLQPVHFILYFNSESTELTDDSMKILPEILELINSRNSQNISVIGHTDTAGSSQYNLQLSQKRASAINLILVQKGVAPTYINSTSHGQMNPLVKTADNTHEPRNRRVEVVVR